jgi:type IV pilus biogenesis protein CpaD/CtpE
MTPRLPLQRTLLCSALALALAGCGGRSDSAVGDATLAANTPAPGGALSEAAIGDEIASHIQAFS